MGKFPENRIFTKLNLKLNPMKQIILAAFFTMILLNSCNKNEQFSTFLLEEKFQIDQQFQSEDNQLKFTITEILDSRCPSDVVCIWQGEAIVKIKVDSPVKGTLELSTFHNLTDTLGSFSFSLIDVSPYPVSTETIELEEYNVTLKIEEL